MDVRSYKKEKEHKFFVCVQRKKIGEAPIEERLQKLIEVDWIRTKLHDL